jgi:hypothetical protein
VAVILRPGKTPDGAEVALVLRHVVKAIRRRWRRVEILVRGDSHYARPEAMTWLERNRLGYVFGLAGNPVLLGKFADLAEDAALGRALGEADKVRRFGAFRYAARSWQALRQVMVRVEAWSQGSDSRFIVTHQSRGRAALAVGGVYCQRGQAENLIKAHKLHLASDRTSCTKGHGEPVPSPDPHRRLLDPCAHHTAPASRLTTTRQFRGTCEPACGPRSLWS